MSVNSLMKHSRRPVLVVLVVVASWWTTSKFLGPSAPSAVAQRPASEAEAASPLAPPAGTGTAATSEHRYPVRIRVPEHLPGVDSGLVDPKGRPVTVTCAVCHSILDEEKSAAQSPPFSGGASQDSLSQQAIIDLKALTGFHKEMPFQHGSLSCFACHDPNDYEAFRLADGQTVSPGRVIELCSQCHGTQRTAYDRGAHGGMTGHWDLSRGPRDRNTCTDCHQAHTPKPSSVLPVPRSIDRFVDSPAQEGASHAG